MSNEHERDVEAAARKLLSEEYASTGQYPAYAQLALDGEGEFTMCSIRAIMRALAPQAGDNAEEPVAWRYRFEPDLPWHAVDYLDQVPDELRWPDLEVAPLYAHPCTSTPVVSQNAPDLEGKGGDE